MPLCKLKSPSSRYGMTLAELMVVISILAILSAMVIPIFSSTSSMQQQALQTTTDQNLTQVRVAILDYYADHAGRLPGPTVSTSRAPHPQLVFLYVDGAGNGFDPVTAIGWKGPYLKSSFHQGRYTIAPANNYTARYGLDGDLAPLDSWGSPIVLQQPIDASWTYSHTRLDGARLVSAGPNGVLETPPDVLVPTLAERGDDVFVWLGATPLIEAVPGAGL